MVCPTTSILILRSANNCSDTFRAKSKQNRIAHNRSRRQATHDSAMFAQDVSIELTTEPCGAVAMKPCVINTGQPISPL